MGLNIALIDKSEIIKKMLSHSLHYFGADVHRFEDLRALPKEDVFDLVFIDWDLKMGTQPLALMARERITHTPIVILHRNSKDTQLEDFHQLKKPIDANLTRKLTAQLVPKVNQLKIHDFLQYPTSKPFVDEHQQGNVVLDLPDMPEDEKELIQPQSSAPVQEPAPLSYQQEGEISLDLPDISEDEKELIQPQSSAPVQEPAPLSYQQEGEISLDLPDISEDEKELIQPQSSAPVQEPAPLSYQQEGEISLDLPDISEDEKELIQPQSSAPVQEPAPLSYQQEGEISLDLPNISENEKELTQPQSSVVADKTTAEFSNQNQSQSESVQTRTLTDVSIVANQPKEKSKTVAFDFSEDMSDEKAISKQPVSLSSKRPTSDFAEEKKQFQYDKQAAEHLTGSTTILERKDRDSRLAADFEGVFDEKESTSPKAHFLEKDNLNLDENTQNDLGPAALVNNLAEQELLDKASLEVDLNKYKKSTGFKELIQGIVKESSHQIIKEAIVKNHQEFIEQILKEYSQTLEFEQILSEILTEYGEEVIRELFMKDSEGIIERSITTYADSSHFKNLMENTLKAFVQESLLIKTQVKDIFSNLLKKEAPLMAKNLIETEIKNLLDETADTENS